MSMRTRLLALALFVFALVTTPQVKAYEIDVAKFCYRYDPTTLLSVGEIGNGNVVFSNSEKIGFWVKIIDPPTEEIRIDWKDPNGITFIQNVVTPVPKTGENWGIVFDSINIAETTAKDKLGIWTVKILINKEPQGTAQFQIINYDSIQQRLNDLSSNVETIQSENDLLKSQNQQLTLQLQMLQADYATLQSQIGTSSNYQTLQADYDDLYDDYQALGRDLGTTRMMMYAAVVVAIASVGVAVYFGAIKKS